MNSNENLLQYESELPDESFDFDELEKKLRADLDEELFDLQIIKEDREKINNPDSLGSTVMGVVWEQFINQIGVVAGEDFIAENRGLTLDLRDSSHIQTTENFAAGKIATHNDKIDYQQRYDDWQENFQKDPSIEHKRKDYRYNEEARVWEHYDNRSDSWKNVLCKDAREDFDKGRPSGKNTSNTNMDHTVSAAEIIRDPSANAHLTKEEQLAFANSEKNLNIMDSAANQSKSDSTMSEFLGSERDGQKPTDRFDIDEDQLRAKDKEAREEYEKQKSEGQERSIKAGKQSQKEEAFRIGGKALRAVVMGLLAELMRNIAAKLIAWLRSEEKNLESFISEIKNALSAFVGNLKQTAFTTGNTLVTTIATAIIGPVVGTIKKAWMFLKQGAKSLKEAIDYIKNPMNKDKSIGVLMLEVGKIVTAGLTAAGAIVLGEVIEKSLTSIPIFAVEIPLIGSLANILGIFLGALVSGLIGAIAMNLIDKVVAKKQKESNTKQQIDKGNKILNTQDGLIQVKVTKLNLVKQDAGTNIIVRHQAGADEFNKICDKIFEATQTGTQSRSKQNSDALDELLQM